MSEHITRMNKEYNELKDKINALAAFIFSNESFKKLSDDEQSRMHRQLGFMEAYCEVLDSRLWCAHNQPVKGGE